MKGFKYPLWAGQQIPYYKCCLLYALIHWCKNSEGREISDEVATKIATDRIFPSKGRATVFQTLRLQRDLGALVAKNLKDVECMRFFGNWAYKVCKEYFRGTPQLLTPVP